MKTMFLANNVTAAWRPVPTGLQSDYSFTCSAAESTNSRALRACHGPAWDRSRRRLAAAGRRLGVEIQTSASVRASRCATAGRHVIWKTARNPRRIVLFQRRSKTNIPRVLDAKVLPEDFYRGAGIKMAGPCAKVNMVLAEEPRFAGTPARPRHSSARFTRSCRRLSSRSGATN